MIFFVLLSLWIRGKTKHMLKTFSFIKNYFPRHFRYNILLSDEDKTQAKRHLSQTWLNLNAVRSGMQCPLSESWEEVADPVLEPPDDIFEELLRERDIARRTYAVRDANTLADIRNIKLLLDSFTENDRLNKNISILEYWEKQNVLQPELHSLAVVTLALPVNTS